MQRRRSPSRARRLAAGLLGALVIVPFVPAGVAPAGGAVTAPAPEVSAATHTGAGLRLVGRNDLGGRG